MGVIETLTGYTEVPYKKLNQKIAVIANKKANKIPGNKRKVIFVTGKNYQYKIIYYPTEYASFNGHETGIARATEYFSKPKTNS